MSRISDEILNKYIDGELNEKSVLEIENILNTSKEDADRLSALKRIHSELGKIGSFSLPGDFTMNVMSKIRGTAKARNKDKYFILTIISFIIALSLGIIGFLAYNIAQTPSDQTTSLNILANYMPYIKNVLDALQRIIPGNTFSFIGSILSFIVIISGYFFFENQKRIHH